MTLPGNPTTDGLLAALRRQTNQSDLAWFSPPTRLSGGFDGLAQFSRQAFLRWIDATKRRPEERARRIAEMVELLLQEEKQRP